MTEEELKKLAEEYQSGLKEIQEIKIDYNKKFENLNKEKFFEAFSKQLNEVIEENKEN